MAKPENLAWGTLEELLLACAVERHGTNSWGYVAKEMQKRTSAFNCFTSQSCEQKYNDLKRRFTSEIDRGSESAASGSDASLWLDELRRRRIAELKQELERYDLSIVSLQLKVKRLSEEREKSEDPSPPLPEDAAEESEEDNQSLSVLNSSDRKGEKSEEHEAENVVEKKSVEATGHPPADPTEETTEPESEDSSKCHASAKTESVELVESVAESIGGEDDGRLGKETSEVQSRDGHSRKKGERNSVFVEEESAAVKPEWVVDFLEEIRRHKLGSVFERRLDSQETSSYKKLIRQHIDLGSIRTRVKAGQYAAESPSKFHRDLLLLATNAAVFFPKRTPEHKAAIQLRQLVSTKFTNRPPKPSTNPPTLQPHPTEEPDSPPLFKPKLLGNVVASRKGTNIVSKPLVGHTQAKNDEKEKSKGQPEKLSWFSVVTKKRTRDQSLASRSSGTNTLSNQSSPDRPSSSKGEPKNEKLKTEGRDKKKSAANFLNRIKSSAGMPDLSSSISGGEAGKNNSSKGAKSSKEGPSKDQGNSSRKGPSPTSTREKGKQRDGSSDEGSKKNVGRPSKKATAELNTGKKKAAEMNTGKKKATADMNTGKRTRESGGNKAEAAPSKKRSRK